MAFFLAEKVHNLTYDLRLSPPDYSSFRQTFGMVSRTDYERVAGKLLSGLPIFWIVGGEDVSHIPPHPPCIRACVYK